MIHRSLRVAESDVRPFLYERDAGLLGWMDGSGSNLVMINNQLPGVVKIVATMRGDSKAGERAQEFGVPLASHDIVKFEREFGVFPGDYKRALQHLETDDPLEQSRILDKIISELMPRHIRCIREDFCSVFSKHCLDVMIEVCGRRIPIFAAGGRAILSPGFLEVHEVFNVHPGDLAKYHLSGVSRGKRSIVGDGWIPSARALSSGHDVLYSSMHLMTAEMDAGPLMMRGYALPIDYEYIMSRVDISDEGVLKEIASAAQEILKHIGDHVIAGATFRDLFDGKWGRHDCGTLAYNFHGEWYLAPNGIMIKDHVDNADGETPFVREEYFIDNKVKEFYAVVDELG